MGSSSEVEVTSLDPGSAHSVVPPSAGERRVRPWFLVPFEALPIPVPWAVAGGSLLLIGATLPFVPEQPAGSDTRIWQMVERVFDALVSP
jgi:hypothetical protein